MGQDMLQRAAAVLKEEAEAVVALADSLDERFVQAVDIILKARGRVVTTGMGKSGHIARKVAATLASTGTPAFYLHPGEGVHGDLGMVTKDDVVLAFSNSGETGEVIQLLPSLKRIGASIIAVVGKDSSTLGRTADCCLLVAVAKEACPLGLAPTSSTTAALALGDALAICLLEKRQFTADEFALYHPGGSLGRKLLLTVADCMHSGDDNPTVGPEATVRSALFMMTSKGLGATNVVDGDGSLLGLVTDGDIRRGLDQSEDFLGQPISAVMTKTPRSIGPDKLAAEALHLMEHNNPRPITVLPVVDEGGRCLGLLHITDLLRRGIV